MIKKIFSMFVALVCVVSSECYGGDNRILISSDAFRRSLNKFTSKYKDIKLPENSNSLELSALEQFKSRLDSDGMISRAGLFTVCNRISSWLEKHGMPQDANEWKVMDGDNICHSFVLDTLMQQRYYIPYNVCDSKDEQRAGGKQFCDTETFGSTQVSKLHAKGLGEAFLIAKYGKENSLYACCNDESCIYEDGNDDYLPCMRVAYKNKSKAYLSEDFEYWSFKFDDLKETDDGTILDDTAKMVCKMHGGTLYDTEDEGTWICGFQGMVDNERVCDTNASKTAERVGLLAYTIQDPERHHLPTCYIHVQGIASADQLNTIRKSDLSSATYSEDKLDTIIDNFAFCKGIQIDVSRTDSLENQLRSYVEGQVANKGLISSFYCDRGLGEYKGQGCHDDDDDIITCYVNHSPIDFVFDDATESWGWTADGGIQGMDCVVAGGTYGGKRCVGLGEQQCNVLRQSNLKNCPECKAAIWDAKTQSCILSSSASAQNLEKGINITLIVGGAVVGIALTVATAGTAGAPVTAIVLTAIETVGAGIELTSQLNIDGITDNFLVESNQCKNAPCAKEMLKQNLQRMANYANDMTNAEANAVDSEMARLANLIPDDDEIWATILINGTNMADNQLGFFDANSWEPEQVWRAVGIGLQLTSVVSSVGKWLLNKTSRVVKSTAAIKNKLARAVQSIEKAPESTLDANRLAIKRMAANGKKVNGGAISIPKGQMAAGIRKADGSVEIIAKSKYTFINDLDFRIKEYLKYPKGLNVGILDNELVYHIDGLAPGDASEIANYLSANNIPYLRHTDNGILFYEKDIVRFGSDIDPNLSSKVQDVLRFEEQAMAQTGDLDQVIIQTSKTTIEMFNKDIYLEDLYRVAETKREKILNIVARDSELTDIALNFETASLERKQRFAQKILNNLDGGNITAEVKIRHSAAGEQDKARIIFGLNHQENTSLDGFITTLSHEHNHYINQYMPKTGALADLPEEILDRTVINEEMFKKYFPNAKFDWYYINSLDEQSSYYIGDYVGQGFKEDLMNLLY